MKRFSEILALNPDTDKEIWHSYGLIYDILFNRYQGSDVDFLEIGLYSGGSTKCIEDFFGPSSRILAVDIDISKIKFDYGPNVTIHQADAYLESTIETIGANGRKFDFILDDSLHSLSSHDYLLTHYTKLLKPDGMIILEDCAYPEAQVIDLCQRHRASYLKNQHNLGYERSSNVRDYDASTIIVKMNSGA